jgi:hypothetical protein
MIGFLMFCARAFAGDLLCLNCIMYFRDVMISAAHIFIYNKYAGNWALFDEKGTGAEKQQIQKLHWTVIDDLFAVAALVKKMVWLVDEKSDTGWSGFDTIEAFIAYLHELHHDLLQASFDALDKLHVDFLPTSTFQEIALANSWSAQYGDLAEAFDALYARIGSNQRLLELPHRSIDEYSEP